jgi:hypothetical protein
MNYMKLFNYAGRYFEKGVLGNPSALTIAAVVAACAVGAYVVESLTKETTNS